MDLSEKINEILPKCRKILNDKESIEDVLYFVRYELNSKLASVKAISILLDMPIPNAKALVHNSLTWQDVKEQNEDFETLMLQAFDALKALEDEG